MNDVTSPPTNNTSGPTASETVTPITTIPSSAPSTPALVIYAPPTATTPAAASQTSYDESDYIPTIDHATWHQSRLAQESRNKRLLSDAELAAQQQARASALSEIKEVIVRIRFPDQSQAQQVFGRDAAAETLYERCEEMMQRPDGEAFSLRVAGAKAGLGMLPRGGQRLITDLGWHGRVLVTVVWGDKVGADVRAGPSLKEEYRARAENLRVEVTGEGAAEMEEKKGSVEGVVEEGRGKEKGKGGAEKEAKMMRFLKGLSKK